MIRDPATGQWTNDASAAIGRFYHSNTVLLPDVAFTHVDANTLQVTIPSNANMISDGYWMLFADNTNGTPSARSRSARSASTPRHPT